MTSPPDDSHRLPTRTVSYYGIGQAAEGITNHTLTTLLLFYYTSVMGLPGSLAGAALMIGLFFDAVTDPLVAVISDRTRSSRGRRHPFMYASAIPLGFFLYMAFVPPLGLFERMGIDEAVLLFAWLTASVVLTRAALTLFHVPHMALGAELSDDFDERTRVVTSRSLYAVLGTAVAVTAYFLLMMSSHSPEYSDPRLNPAPYAIYAALAGFVIVVAILLSAWGTRDRIPHLLPPDQDLSGQSFRSALVTDLRESLRIPSFRALFLGFTVCFLAFGFSNAIGTHSALYLWHVSVEVQALYGIAILVGTLSGMWFWRSYATKHDKRPTFIVGITWFTLFAAAPPIFKVIGLFPAEDSTLYVPAFMAVGFGWSFAIASAYVVVGSMMADITDEDELLHDRRREGIFFGALSFGSKTASGLGTIVAGVVYDWAGLHRGLDPGDAPASASVTLGLCTGFIIMILVAGAITIFRRYDITRERHDEIIEALAARASIRSGPGESGAG